MPTSHKFQHQCFIPATEHNQFFKSFICDKGEKAHAMEKTMPSQYIRFNTSHPHFQLSKYSSSMNHTILSRKETPNRSFQRKSSISRSHTAALRGQQGGASLTSSSWWGQPPLALQSIRHGVSCGDH